MTRLALLLVIAALAGSSVVVSAESASSFPATTTTTTTTNPDGSSNVLPHAHDDDTKDGNSIKDDDDDDDSTSLLFTCPQSDNDHDNSDGTTATALNDNFDGYWETYLHMNERNLRRLQRFRTQTYDYRQDPYHVMKRKTRPYKRAYFGNALSLDASLSSSSLDAPVALYESACGQGFNLYMTLEILKEEWESLYGNQNDSGDDDDDDDHGEDKNDNQNDDKNSNHTTQPPTRFPNITVYANDYLAESVHIANTLFRHVAPQPDLFATGALCRGDSTNLRRWVPDDSMDLAYTGFIDPLLDPLNLLAGSGATIHQVESMMEHLCASAKGVPNETTGEYRGGDPLHQRLTELMQEKQEDWHSQWVVELIRIAKPGKYIIIEDVGWPGCSDMADWAGVDTEWWHTAVDTYGWNVYPESIQIVEKAWYGDRYNVRMQKKKLHNAPYTDQALDEQSRKWFEEFDGWKVGGRRPRNHHAEEEEDDDEEEEEWDEEEEEEWDDAEEEEEEWEEEEEEEE